MTGLLLFEESSTDFLFSFPTAAANLTFSTFGYPYLLKATHFHSQSSEDTNDKLDLSSNTTHSLKIDQTNQPKHITLDKDVTENFRDGQNIPVPEKDTDYSKNDTKKRYCKLHRRRMEIHYLNSILYLFSVKCHYLVLCWQLQVSHWQKIIKII